MNKLERFHEGEWVTHRYPRMFIRETTSGPERLRIGLAEDSIEVVQLLLSIMEEPLTLLYVLHTPREEALPGRYQSPKITRRAVSDILNEFGAFLTSDSRHDLWIRSSNDLLVWDRHDVVYFYGDLTAVLENLQLAGYENGSVLVPSPHAHNYHSVFDADERSLVKKYAWTRSELRPEDEQ